MHVLGNLVLAEGVLRKRGTTVGQGTAVHNDIGKRFVGLPSTFRSRVTRVLD
jgi:hypothetical protein